LQGHAEAFSAHFEDVDCNGVADLVLGEGPVHDSLAASANDGFAHATAEVFRWSSDDDSLVFLGSVSSPGLAKWLSPPAFDVGDTNGDGCGDVMLLGMRLHTATINDDPRANAALFLGAPGGLVSVSAWQAGNGMWGIGDPWDAVRLGDVDGDGFGDVLVVAENRVDSTHVGQLSVFRGSREGLATGATWVVDEPWSQYAPHVSGDVNGDGRVDVFVSGDVYFGEPGRPPGPFDGTAGVPIPGVVATATGDVNGDGCADFAVPGQGVITTIYSGGEP